MNEISQRPPCTRRNFIAEFEGLRGILAAWVVFGHILVFSGFAYQDGWFGLLFSPVLGVYAFMMLSGFVITAAIDQRPITWFEFMTRRIWRIFPVYALCMALAVMLFSVSVHVSQSSTLVGFGPKNLERLNDVSQHFELYLLADSVLLQCLLPRGWFSHAHESFLPPTWSLTIEWIFYICAPPLVWLIKRVRWWALAFVGSLVSAIYMFQPWLVEFVNQSFHVGNALHFLTGIGSYYVWKHLPDRKNCWVTKIVFWSTFAGGIALLNFPYKIWLATMVMVLYPRLHRRPIFFIEWPRNILISLPLQFLGRTSYVTYLLHWIVIEMVLFWVIQLAPGISDRLVLAVICTVLVYPLTYLFSDIIHRHVEVPMMRVPKHWFATWKRGFSPVS